MPIHYSSKDKLVKSLASAPIKIPRSPFWEVFRRFGRDEAISLVINTIGTIIISFFFSAKIILAVAGPIIEKIGFFPGHFKEARELYKNTPIEKRKSMGFYYKRAVKNGSKSLIEDILFHDPLYIFFMYFGLVLYSQTPAWVLSVMSFIIAVILVSFFEVAFNEIRYQLFARRLLRAGFEKETYYEARFFISKDANSKEIIRKLSKEFRISTIKKGNYQDRYYESEIPDFNGRDSVIRLRNRDSEKGKKMQSLQIVFTRAREMKEKGPYPSRCFPSKKEKFYYLLRGKMPADIDQIKNQKIKNLKRYVGKGKINDIRFTRRVMTDPKKMLVSLDEVTSKKPFHIVELKAYKENIVLFKEAMRYVMINFPVLHITHRKIDLKQLEED